MSIIKRVRQEIHGRPQIFPKYHGNLSGRWDKGQAYEIVYPLICCNIKIPFLMSLRHFMKSFSRTFIKCISSFFDSKTLAGIEYAPRFNRRNTISIWSPSLVSSFNQPSSSDSSSCLSLASAAFSVYGI